MAEMVEEFSADVFEDFEQVRKSGVCNMLDRRCVQEAAEMLLDPVCDLVDICEDGKAYARLLMAFSAWKEATEKGTPE